MLINITQYPLRILAKFITKNKWKSSFLDKLNVSNDISYDSCIYWLFRYYDFNNDTKQLMTVIRNYSELEFLNVSLTSRAAELLINHEYHELAHVLVKNKGSSLNTHTVMTNYKYFKDHGLLKYCGTDYFKKLMSSSNDLSEFLSLLTPSMNLTAYENSKIIKYCTKIMIENHDYKNFEKLYNALSVQEIKGGAFYYWCILLIHFNLSKCC